LKQGKDLITKGKNIFDDRELKIFCDKKLNDAKKYFKKTTISPRFSGKRRNIIKFSLGGASASIFKTDKKKPSFFLIQQYV